MRTSTLLLSAAAGALIAMGVTAGTASATTPAAQEPGALSASVSRAAPGQEIRVSGTCPTPSAGTAQPVVQSVTSPAFTGPESFSKTDPMAFDGTATIARTATAGSHVITLTCSNGTASTAITVTTATTAAPTPTPAPAPHTSGGVGGGAAYPTATPITGPGGSVVVEEPPAGDGVPWGWITAGAVVLVGGGAGAGYVISRRRPRGGPGTGGDSDSPTERMHV